MKLVKSAKSVSSKPATLPSISLQSTFSVRRRAARLAGRRQRLKVAGLLGAIATVLTALPASGAERIQFFFGPFEPTIYIEDLETFAETGEVADRLEFFAKRLSDEQKEGLRSLLTARHDISPIPVSQFTYSPVGEQLLQKVGQVIQTENFLSGMKAVRASLILAAADEERGFTALNILRQYPLDTIQLNFSLARQIAAENEQIFMRRNEAIAAIKQAATAQAINKADMPSASSPATDPQFSGSFAWQVRTLSFQNPARPESSLADVYYPAVANAAPASTPVVVISHGLASDRQTFAYLAEHLASHGYAVVALEHAETSADRFVNFLWGKQGPPAATELLLGPQDITAALDALNAQQRADSDLQHLNLEAVGLLGQSLGGYNVLATSGATIDRPYLESDCRATLAERPTLNISVFVQCLVLDLPEDASLAVADPRVAAAVALNPVTSSIFGRSGLQNIEVPVMLVAGSDDYVTPALPEQIEPFDWLETEHKKLVIMEKGTHFSFLDRETRGALPFSGGLVGPDPHQARPQVRALSLAFFDRYLRDRSASALFLNQTYLDEFPQDPFKFSLVDELPEQRSKQ